MKMSKMYAMHVKNKNDRINTNKQSIINKICYKNYITPKKNGPNKYFKFLKF